MCTTILQGRLETSQALKSTFAGSMARRSGSARSAPRNMLCSQIGKHTPKLVAPKSINVTVELHFQGNILINYIPITLVEEENESFFIRVWKPLPSKRILKL